MLSSLNLTQEQIDSIFPLNKLSEDDLRRLRPDMRLLRLRANRELFSVGDAPSESFWVIDGVLQLADRNEERIETVSMSRDGLAIPLPYIVPANESARALVDCTILCVDRARMTALMAQKNIQMIGHAPPPDPITKTDQDFFREFEKARELQGRTRPHRTQDTDTAEIEDPFANALGEENRPVTYLRQPIQRVPHIDQTELETAREALSVKKTVGTEDVRSALAAFATLPGYEKLDLALRVECLQQCETLDFAPGQMVKTADGEDDSWHLIMVGECKALFADGDEELEVDRYGQGNSFGEDRLISGRPDNIAVEALTYVRVLRLPSRAFRRLLLPKMLKTVTADQLRDGTLADATWLDVRLPQDRGERAIVDAVEIPWPVISTYPFSDNPGSRCIVVCQSGHDSAAVTFKLRKYGFDAYAFEGGIDHVPSSRITARTDPHEPDVIIRIN